MCLSLGMHLLPAPAMLCSAMAEFDSFSCWQCSWLRLLWCMQLGVAASLLLNKPAYAPDSTHDILSKPAYAPDALKDTLGWKASSPDSHSRHLLDLTTKVRRSAQRQLHIML